jgi:hypothetical protein
MTVGRGATSRRNMHIDEGVLASGVLAGDQNRIGVANEAQVREALIFVRTGNGEVTMRIVGRYWRLG